MSFLRQSTQVVKKIGPYLDKTDGVTEEVGLAGAGTEISKEPGAAFGTGPTLGTHDAEGWYPVTLTTAHTDTVGLLIIKGQDAATHLPVWHEFTVVEEAVYDRDYKATATGVDADWTNTGRLDALLDALTPAGPTKSEMDTAHGLLATEAKQDIIDTNVDTLVAKLVGITLLNEWLGAIAGKQNADATALTEIKATGAGSGTYDPNADSTEAIRDRGDAAWVTATGFALASVLGALDDVASAGDVTSSDTLMQYLKQLLNEISGGVGIGTMPSAADPANGINLFEMVRAAMGATFATATDSLEQLQADGVAIQTVVDDIQTQVGTAGAGLGDLGGMSTAMKAEVNAEVDGALDTAISELSQGIPTATPTMRTGLMLLYMALRNKLDVATSATDTLEIHNDAGTRIAQKLLTDDGSDYSEAKMTSGA